MRPKRLNSAETMVAVKEDINRNQATTTMEGSKKKREREKNATRIHRNDYKLFAVHVAIVVVVPTEKAKLEYPFPAGNAPSTL